MDTPFDPVPQQYLLEARHVQALSFAVHIPLVCFGMAFPVLVSFLDCGRSGPAIPRQARSRGGGAA